MAKRAERFGITDPRVEDLKKLARAQRFHSDKPAVAASTGSKSNKQQQQPPKPKPAPVPVSVDPAFEELKRKRAERFGTKA